MKRNKTKTEKISQDEKNGNILKIFTKYKKKTEIRYGKFYKAKIMSQNGK